MRPLAAALVASLAAACVSTPASYGVAEAKVPHADGLASRKASAAAAFEGQLPGPGDRGGSPATPAPLLATLVQTHTDERVPLDDVSPTQERFAALLADRVTGERHPFDPKLLELLRALARKHPAARIELVSGYRSPKLNEAMRKKGHHVASHSQHSLGHAVDFRVVVPVDVREAQGEVHEMRPLDPRVLEKEIRDLGWEGGVGVYTLSSDWFVHADVGRNRRWTG